MEINLFHAFFGRFAVLIPVLGLFFEIAAIITQKPFVSKLSGFIVIFASLLVFFAGFSGYEEYLYLKSVQEAYRFSFHETFGILIATGFFVVFVLRGYLLKKENVKVATFYIFFYVILVMINLLSNEVVVHKLRAING